MLSVAALLSIAVIVAVYFFLMTEKLDKVIVAIGGAALLILVQVFAGEGASSEQHAFEFISHNLDVLGFVIGMMILIAVIRGSGVFEAIAVWIVKKVNGDPRLLLFGIGYLTLFMTAFLSNIPTVLILSPVILVLVRSLKLPYFPFFFTMICMANVGGAISPISDPTTYYQASVVGLGFLEVVKNSGLIVLVLSIVTSIYTQIVFRKPLGAVRVSARDVARFDPKSAIKNWTILKVGLPLLLLVIVTMMLKDTIRIWTGVTLDNAAIVIAAAFFSLWYFDISPRKALHEFVEWETIFFFLGLFIVVGSLEFTGVINVLASWILQLTGGDITKLLFFITTGSGILSTFIDNVPYNIAMVGAVLAMAKAGVAVYPLWWGLNVGTSIGGAGSMIGAACNVIAIGQAEKEGFHTTFLKYLAYGAPLVLINCLVAFTMVYYRYL